MQVTTPTVAQAIQIYMDSRATRYAANTLKRNRTELNHMASVLGPNTKVTAVDDAAMDRVLAFLSTRMAPASYNNAMSTLGSFFRFCARRGFTPAHHDPIGDRRYLKVPKTDKRRVPLAKFQALLDATEYPRDRLIVALGLYLFLRQSEIATLKVGDVNLTDGEIAVTIHKTGDFDMMPICAELDVELRRYLTAYTTEMGGLDPDWHLCPSRFSTLTRGDRGRLVKSNMTSRPTRMMTHIEDVAKNALEKIGHPVRDENGKGLFEGIHTLRRSGARALFDEMRSQGYDGALQRVRAMLHHASGTMTERYLGISVERQQRNESLRGQSMFNISGENVVALGGRDGAGKAVGL